MQDSLSISTLISSRGEINENLITSSDPSAILTVPARQQVDIILRYVTKMVSSKLKMAPYSS